MLFRPVVLLCLLLPLSASADDAPEAVDAIRAAVLATVEAGVTADAVLDPSLHMPRCRTPLTAQRQGGSTVEVTCAQQWRLYVPLKLHRPQRVLVLTRGVAAGETISADMFTLETREASRIVGAAPDDPAAAIGQVARRALAAGSVLTSGHLVAPRLVHRGDSVELVARRSGIEVRMAGRALNDAGADERVNVINPSTRRTLHGRVLADGGVLVN